MNEEAICPICGRKKGVGSIGVPKVESAVEGFEVNIQISVSVYNDDDPEERCIGHEAAEYASNVPPVPQLFYDVFKEEREMEHD